MAQTQDARRLRSVLFDFEKGVSGWHGNPWGGGTCGPEAAGEAATGQGALCCRYSEVEEGANVISPEFAEDAAWRREGWGHLTFWLKGDGTAEEVSLILECAEDGHATYSRRLSLQPDEWHRISLPLNTLWNRTGRKIDISRLRRLYFGAKGTHSLWIDHVALEAEHRVVPLDPLPTVAIPRLDAVPVLDGSANEECWTRAERLPGFKVIDGSAVADEQTECRLFHDGTRLHVSAVLKTREPDKLKTSFTRHDAPLWKDDTFEIFIGNADPAKKQYQFVVNPAGATLELGGDRGVSFEHDWQAATTRRKDGWSVEISLALAPLVPAPLDGQTFALNLARENRVTGELSCWSPTGKSFLRPARFGQALLLGSERGLDLPAPEWLDLGDGQFAARLVGSRGAQGPLRTRLEFGGKTFEASTPAVPRPQDGIVLGVPTSIEDEGWGRVVFVSGKGDRTAASVHAGRFRIFQPAVAEPACPLPIVPSPKELAIGEGVFSQSGATRVHCAGGVDERTRRYLARELRTWYGIDCRLDHPNGETADIVLWRPGKTGNQTRLSLDKALVERLQELPPGGYVLHIASPRAVVAANDDRGLHYGVLTLLQVIQSATDAPSVPRATCCTVIDWPGLKWRAVRIGLPTTRWGHPNNAPVEIGFFRDFIERSIVRRKLNMLVIEVNAGLQYESRPEIGGSAAWTKDELRQLLQLCRDHFIEPVPLVNSYGHAGYLTLRHPELREDGRLNTICTRHPDSWTLLKDLYGELIDLFAPLNYFHVGLDEIRWQTLDVPEAKRCPRCAGASKGELLAEHVTRLREWLHERGLRPIMWGDQLLTEHNGGPPYSSVEALERLPRDVIIANWSTTLAGGSNRGFRAMGFTVWQSNSRGVNREQADYCEGNMFGAWDKRPWLSDCPWRSGQSYNFLSFLLSAEYSWNLWPEVHTVMPSLDTRWFQARERVLALDAAQPEPAAGDSFFTVPLEPNFASVVSSPASEQSWFGGSPDRDLRHVPRGRQVVAGVPFDLLPPGRDCVSPLPDANPAEVKLDCAVASLRFLHTVHIREESEAVLTKAFENPEYWRGIPCGSYRAVYVDGTTDEFPILYPHNVKRWDMGDKIPYVFRSPGILLGSTDAMKQANANGRDICLYVAQWVNPKPAVPVKKIELLAGGIGVPVLFAVTGRPLQTSPSDD